MSAAVHSRMHSILDGQWRTYREIYEDVYCSSEAIHSELEQMLAAGELISRPTNARGGVEYARARAALRAPGPGRPALG